MLHMDNGWFYVKCLASLLVVIATLNQALHRRHGICSSHDENRVERSIFFHHSDDTIPRTFGNASSANSTVQGPSSHSTDTSNIVESTRPVEVPCWRLLLENGTIYPNKTWAPITGCEVRNFTPREVQQCMSNRAKIAPDKMDLWFFGDSRVRYLYYWLLERLWNTKIPGKKVFHDVHNEVKKPRINMDLYWDIFLKEKIQGKLQELLTENNTRRPGFLILSTCFWYLRELRDGSPFETAMRSFNETLHHLLPLLNRVAVETDVKVMWVLQDPMSDELAHAEQGEREKYFKDMHVSRFNAHAESVLSGTNVLLWKSARDQALLWGDYLPQKKTFNAYHMGPKTLWAKANLLLNIYCQHTEYLMQVSNEATSRPSNCTLEMCQSASNAACGPEKCRDILSHVQEDNIQDRQRRINSRRSLIKSSLSSNVSCGSENCQPILGNSSSLTNVTCAPHRVPEACSLGQLCIVGLFFVLALYWYVCSVTQLQEEGKNEQNAMQYREAAIACSSFGLILCYFLLCDRFNYFPIEEKHFHWAYFSIPLIVVLAIGAWHNAPSESDDLLNRNHTDEWKGWMQLVILVYHFTGASQNLGIYFHLRVIVSSYLFLSGYGHFCYYYSKQDFGVFRFAQVLFRMNFLTVVLCLVMSRPYQFYYFVPLVSYWYIVVYITMAVLTPGTTKKVLPENEGDQIGKVSAYGPNLWLGAKFLTVCIAVTAMWFSHSSFDTVFGAYLWRWLFATSDDSLHEWYFRWSLDRYSTLYGVAAAACVYAAKKSKRLSRFQGRHLSAGLTITALASIVCYEFFQRHFSEKPQYNFYHPFVTMFPILSFIILRHVLSMVTNRYSYFFAGVGRISLELFIGQYHIWLADDTHTTLVLVPGNAAINICVTTIVFVAAAHHIHHVTATLAKLLIPKDLRVLIRNVMCMAFVIGIYAALS